MGAPADKPLLVIAAHIATGACAGLIFGMLATVIALRRDGPQPFVEWTQWSFHGQAPGGYVWAIGGALLGFCIALYRLRRKS